MPSLPVAPDRAVRDAVGPLRPAELAPAFSTDVMRRTATVEVSAADRGTALVEVALDSGEIRAQGRRDRVSELELELIEGPASALYALAMTLQASAPLCIQTASKAKRGYVLAGGEGYAGCKAPHDRTGAGELRGPGPRRDLSRLRRSLRREPRCGAGPQRSRRGPPVSRRPAPAALGHRGLQGRSAAGRRRPGWKREASRLIGVLGPARDWDVFITETLAAVRAARPADDNLKRLAQAAEAERARAPMSRRKRCGPPPTRRSCSASAAGSRPPAGATRRTGRCSAGRSRASPGACSTSGMRGSSSMGATSSGSPTIASTGSGSRSRSCAMPASSLPPQFPDGRPRPYIKAVRRLQDDLGRLNDAAVAERRLSELLRAQPESAALAALGVGAGQVIGWHARARGEARARINGDWRAFAAAEPYWRAGSGRSHG